MELLEELPQPERVNAIVQMVRMLVRMLVRMCDFFIFWVLLILVFGFGLKIVLLLKLFE